MAPDFGAIFVRPRTDRFDIFATSATYRAARHPRRLNRLRSGISHTNMLRRQRLPDFNKSVPLGGVMTDTVHATAPAVTRVSDAYRWMQLVIGVAAMVMIANYQYGWTFF